MSVGEGVCLLEVHNNIDYITKQTSLECVKETGGGLNYCTL